MPRKKADKSSWKSKSRKRKLSRKRKPKVKTENKILAEYLEFILNKKDAVELANKMIKKYGSISNIISLNEREFKKTRLHKTIIEYFMATKDILNKALLETIQDVNIPIMSSSSAVRNYLKVKYKNAKIETFSVMYMDNQGRLLAHEEISKGTINRTPVYPRIMTELALEHNAVSCILVHNHPGGLCEFSSQDKTVTRNAGNALYAVDCNVLDHFVVCGDKIISMRENNTINFNFSCS